MTDAEKQMAHDAWESEIKEKDLWSSVLMNRCVHAVFAAGMRYGAEQMRDQVADRVEVSDDTRPMAALASMIRALPLPGDTP